MPVVIKIDIRYLKILVFGLAIMLLAACQDDSPPENETATRTRTTTPTTETLTTQRVLPTLYPSRTSTPDPLPTQIRTPSPTEIPSTPLAFDEIVVDLRYAIPALNLERTLRGNVSSALEITDETSGETITLRDQTGVLFELQQSLAELELSELPEGCGNCVQLEYSLPLQDLEGSGWLTDKRMLASIENYTAANIGPHLPEDTVVALRRSATPYRTAQSLALTSDGRLWRWNAVDDEISDPILDQGINSQILSLLSDIDLSEVQETYYASCPGGAGLESFYLSGSDELKAIDFICPELSLPGTLVPLYLELHNLLAEIQAEDTPEEPFKELQVESLLFYRRSDGSWMNLMSDGKVSFTDTEGVTYTSSITPTLVLDLSQTLQDSGILETGTEVFTGEPVPNVLFVRGTTTVFSTGWMTDTISFDREVILNVYELLDQFQNELPPSDELIEGTSTPVDSPTPVPTP
jgi:hypothetical protein